MCLTVSEKMDPTDDERYPRDDSSICCTVAQVTRISASKRHRDLDAVCLTICQMKQTKFKVSE